MVRLRDRSAIWMETDRNVPQSGWRQIATYRNLVGDKSAEIKTGYFLKSRLGDRLRLSLTSYCERLGQILLSIYYSCISIDVEELFEILGSHEMKLSTYYS